jgi:hypothetical protein
MRQTPCALHRLIHSWELLNDIYNRPGKTRISLINNQKPLTIKHFQPVMKIIIPFLLIAISALFIILSLVA